MIQITVSYEKVYFEIKSLGKFLQLSCARSHGVMVSTLDFESSDPSSNLGGTWWKYICTFWYPKYRTFYYSVINT